MWGVILASFATFLIFLFVIRFICACTTFNGLIHNPLSVITHILKTQLHLRIIAASYSQRTVFIISASSVPLCPTSTIRLVHKPILFFIYSIYFVFIETTMLNVIINLNKTIRRMICSNVIRSGGIQYTCIVYAECQPGTHSHTHTLATSHISLGKQ